jgi:hypothetical protein
MSTVTTADKLTIVKLLAAGRDKGFVAAAVGHDVDTVVRAAAGHGYPDRAKLAWAADILQQQIDDDARAAVPSSTVRPIVPRPAGSADVPARTARPAVTSEQGADIRSWIARGLKSETARVRRLAQKAADAVDALDSALTEDEATRRAAAAQAAEKARARQEVERLERELAAAKALLRGDRPAAGGAVTPPAAAVAGVESKAVRAWAAQAGVECPKAGRVPRAVVEAYLARGVAA